MQLSPYHPIDTHTHQRARSGIARPLMRSSAAVAPLRTRSRRAPAGNASAGNASRPQWRGRDDDADGRPLCRRGRVSWRPRVKDAKSARALASTRSRGVAGVRSTSPLASAQVTPSSRCTAAATWPSCTGSRTPREMKTTQLCQDADGGGDSTTRGDPIHVSIPRPPALPLPPARPPPCRPQSPAPPMRSQAAARERR